ncbi:MAG: hypothetical protein ABW056_05265 [Thermoanaerobaculia bacterium]
MRPREESAEPALPARATRRIAASLDAARLRRGERDEIEAELAAHLEDGLDSGRDLDALLEDFGEPLRAGALLGRSVRRRRRTRSPVMRAARLFTLAIAVVYAGLFARLHTRAPERGWESPGAAAAAWRLPHETERAAVETVLASMYTEGEDGRLTAAGLRAFQAWKGKTAPSLWSVALEPAYFPNPARRGEARREFERFLRLAEDPGPTFEVEREALLGDRGRALRFVALQIPLERLAAARAAVRSRSRRNP